MYVRCVALMMGRAKHGHLRLGATHLFPIGGSDSGRKAGAVDEGRLGKKDGKKKKKRE